MSNFNRPINFNRDIDNQVSVKISLTDIGIFMRNVEQIYQIFKDSVIVRIY